MGLGYFLTYDTKGNYNATFKYTWKQYFLEKKVVEERITLYSLLKQCKFIDSFYRYIDTVNNKEVRIFSPLSDKVEA